MLNVLRWFLVLGVVLPCRAQMRNIGPIVYDYNSKSLPVRVSANVPELNTLAQIAFAAHGRYRLVAADFLYDIRFTQVGPAQVQVDISRSGAPFAAEQVSGDSLRHALWRAADLAVEKTNGLGLKGFFTARLAFVAERTGKREVYISDLFFTPGQVRQETHDNASVLTPRWSPDGSRLIFTSFYKSGFPDIFLLDPMNGRKETFASFKGLNSGARFSPNGQQVAMVLSGEGSPEIYISNAQGRQVARRTHSDEVKSSPCWSPDGSRLVFAMSPGPQLYVMSAAGGSPARLATGYTYAAEPDWCRANPNKIACTVRVAGGRYQIAVYDFTTGKATVVSEAPFDAVMPSWLADGRHLVYTARSKNTSALHILDTETGKSTRISPVDFNAMEANVWTP